MEKAMLNEDDTLNVYYRLGKAEGRCLRFKIALEKVKNLVSGSYEMLDPQAKIEILKVVSEALDV